MSYAIVEAAGQQHKVQEDDVFDIDRQPAGVGAQVTLDRVLLVHTGADVQIGRPVVKGARVVCTVVEHRRGPKVMTLHYRRRKNSKQRIGHRQELTRLRVTAIHPSS